MCVCLTGVLHQYMYVSNRGVLLQGVCVCLADFSAGVFPGAPDSAADAARERSERYVNMCQSTAMHYNINNIILLVRRR